MQSIRELNLQEHKGIKLDGSIAYLTDSLKIENKLKTDLNEADSRKDYKKQCLILQELAEYHINIRKDYISAAKLLNVTLAICQKRKKFIADLTTYKESLDKQLREIEVRFFNAKITGKAYPKSLSERDYGININYKIFLQKLRKIVKYRIKKIDKLPSILKSIKAQQLSRAITRVIKIFLKTMIQDCVNLLPAPPEGLQYAFVGMGSLAREEMTPYSDLEYFILTNSNNSKYKEYLRNLTELLAIKIINLGETDIVKGQTLLPLGMINPVPKGLSLDIHKNANNEDYELIGTPEQLAMYQEHYIEKQGNHLSGALLNTINIVSTDNKLLGEYKRIVKELYNKTDEVTKCLLRSHRALNTLKKDIDSFAPKLSSEDQGRLFRVKEEIFRFPQSIMDALSLYHSLNESSTWKRVDKLYMLGKLSEEARRRLKYVIGIAIFWRLRTYSAYERQHELVDTLIRLDEMNAIRSVNANLGSSIKDLVELTRIYKTLIPLHDCSEKFYISKGKEEIFQYTSLYDDSFFTRGMIETRFCQYETAKEYFEKALLEENVDKAACFNNLADIYRMLGQYKKAMEYFQQTIEMEQKKYGKESIIVAKKLSNLAITFNKLGNCKESIKLFEEALAIVTKINGEEHSDVSMVLCNFGETLRAAGEAKRSVGCYEKALLIEEKFFGTKHPNIAVNLNNLGLSLQELAKFKSAIEKFEQALEININTYGTQHTHVAQNFANLGSVWEVLGDFKKAYEYHTRALEIDIKMYGLKHPEVATDFNNLGSFYESIEEFDKAIKYYEKALAIDVKVYGIKHPDVARDLNNLGSILGTTGNLKKSLYYFEQALKIQKKIHGEEHPGIATSLNNRGNIKLNLGDFKGALRDFNDSLAMRSKLFGDAHPDIATVLSNRAGALHELERPIQALASYQQALKIFTSIYGVSHHHIATVYNNIAAAFKDLGKADEAIKYLNKALEIDLKIYGKEHSSVSRDLENLGGAYHALGSINKAIEYYKWGLDLDIKIFGEKHHHVANDLSNLGTALKEIGNLMQAINYYERALKIDIEIYQKNHPSIAVRLNNLADAMLSIKPPQAQQAEEYCKEALKINLEAYGGEHSAVAATYNNLGVACKYLRKMEEAKKYFTQAFQLDKKLKGNEHPDLIIDLINLGAISNGLLEAERAIIYLNQALILTKKLIKSQDHTVQKIYEFLSESYIILGDRKKANEILYQFSNKQFPSATKNSANSGSQKNNYFIKRKK